MPHTPARTTGRALLAAVAVAAAVVSAAPGAGAQEVGPVTAFVAEATDRLRTARRAAPEGADWTRPLIAAADAPDATPDTIVMGGFARRARAEGPADHAEACGYHRRAAEQGFVPAMHFLGECYAEGHLRDDRAANLTRWYEAAVAGGSLTSKCALGEQLMSGALLDQDIDRGVDLCAEAAEAGSPPAQMTMADLAMRSERPDVAAHWLKRAIGGGSGQAAMRLGVMVLEDQYAPKDLAERAAIAEATGTVNRPGAYRIASDLYSDHVLAGMETAEDRLTGDYGYRTYYWTLLTFYTHDNDAVRQLAELRLRAIVTALGKERVEGWYQRARAEARGE